MKDRSIHFRPIGVIRTPHHEGQKTPIQPVFAKGIKGTVEMDPEYQKGLKDLDGFSHIYLLYYFDRSEEMNLRVVPYLDSRPRGLFATRAPHRPNKIGLSLVRLTGIQDRILHIEDVDMLDQTPLLDIKPFIERFDVRTQTRCGWQGSVSDDVACNVGSRKHHLQNFKSKHDDRM